MIDMIMPIDATNLILADFLNPERRLTSGILFDVLFNLNKFLRFEMRDPFQEKVRREDGFLCDWDRFAHYEYNRLAAEEGVEQSQQNCNNSQQYQNTNILLQSSTGYNIPLEDDYDDYHMFSDDENDQLETIIMTSNNTCGQSTQLQVSSSSGNSNLSNNSNSVNRNKMSFTSYGDWTLDDESDDDDLQLASSKYYNNSMSNHSSGSKGYSNTNQSNYRRK